MLLCLVPGGIRFLADLCARKGFRGSPSFDIDGTLQLLYSDHVRERDKAAASEYPCWECLESVSSWENPRSGSAL